MTDLTNLISAAVAAKMTPDFIEKEIDARVNKLLIESIDNALRSYSGVGKMIKDAVEEALKVDSIDLPAYGGIVTKMLKAQIEARCSELVAGRLADDMEQLLKLAPKEIKLSAIADDMRESRDEDGWGEVITVIVEHSNSVSGYKRIYLDDMEVHERRNSHRCRYHIAIDSDGKIYSATINGHDLQSVKHIGRAYGLDQSIRAWVACGTKVIVDEDNVVTSVGDY